MAATAPAPELGTDDRDDLDTGFTQQGVGLGVPVVGDDDARLEDGETVDLADRTFVSTDVRGHDLVEDTSVTLSFESDQVSASAGCNTFMGAASWDDGTLSLDDEELAATMMACSPEQQEQDDWLTGFLASSPDLTLDGSTLTVGDDVSGMTLEEQ
jgi:heat shock protein HslJ